MKNKIKSSLINNHETKIFYLILSLLILFSFTLILNPKFNMFVIKENNPDVFNLKVEIPETYESVKSGENIWFTTKLLNLANQERIDVTLKYEILNSNKEIIASKSETVAVETQASFVGNLRIPKDTKKGLYYLKVTLISPNDETSIESSFKIINEETKNQIIIKFSLFDINVEIPEIYKKINPGSELLTTIKLINVGSEGRVDVFLDYDIKDGSGKSIMTKKETVAVETQAGFVRTFKIPEDAKQGKYTISAKITYADGKFAEGHNEFEIIRKPGIFDKINPLYLIIGISILIIIIILTLILRNSKEYMEKFRIRSKIHSIVKNKEKQ